MLARRASPESLLNQLDPETELAQLCDRHILILHAIYEQLVGDISEECALSDEHCEWVEMFDEAHQEVVSRGLEQQAVLARTIDPADFLNQRP
jgi:hypothetical protein